MNHTPSEAPRLCVGALIEKDGKFFIMFSHKWGDRGCVPGGGVDGGETLERAVIRETMEETGMRVQPLRLICVQESLSSPEYHKPSHFVSVNFHCRWLSGEPVLNEEAQSCGWYTREDALKLELNSITRELIRRYDRLAWVGDGAG